MRFISSAYIRSICSATLSWAILLSALVSKLPGRSNAQCLVMPGISINFIHTKACYTDFFGGQVLLSADRWYEMAWEIAQPGRL